MNIWVFLDNQAAIQRIQSTKTGLEHHLVIQCQQVLQDLINYNVTSHLHWISGHKDIKGNELADKSIKMKVNQSDSPDSERFIFISYVRWKIKINALKNWKTHWKTAIKEWYYSQFDQTSSFQIRECLKSADRLSFSIFT